MIRSVEVYILFCRLLMVLLTAEVTARYGLWWWKTRTGARANLLRKLTLGIAVNSLGFLFLLSFALTYARTVDPRSPFFVPLPIGYTVMLMGMLLHLVPCWEITCGLNRRRIWREVLWRAVLSGVAALWLIER